MMNPKNRKARKAEERLHRKAQAEKISFCLQFPRLSLQHLGPIIETDIGITDIHRQLLIDSGMPVPSPVRCRLLLDTGADTCMVKPGLAERAGLKLLSEGVPIHGIGVDLTGRVYLGRLWFKCPSKFTPSINHQICIDSEIASSDKLDNDIIDGVIGRTVLSAFELRYNGKTGRVSLTFLHKETSGPLEAQE